LIVSEKRVGGRRVGGGSRAGVAKAET